MHKYIYIAILILFCATELFAAGELGNTLIVSKYEITMLKFEVYYDRRDDGGDAGWHTTFEGSQMLNIASANAGQQVGSFVTGVSLPVGHISQMRRTLSGTFVVNATISYSGSTYYTKSNGAATMTAPAQDASIAAQSGNITSTNDTDITVSEGTTVNVKITFNLLSANGDGTSGCVGILQVGPLYVTAPRQPNVSQEVL